MPTYHPPTAAAPARLVKCPPSPRARRPSTGVEEDLWTNIPSSSTAAPPPLQAPPSPKAGHSRSLSRDGSSKLKRKLQRWTNTSRDLDFGCAGEWSAEGPADLGDRFYSAYPGGSNRVSTASSVDQRSWTHSRGPSTSSNFSVSTAASSIPSSPVLPCIPEPVSPKTSRVPLTPRTAQRRQNEAAGLDAVNQYFQRVRLSQIEEVASTKDSRRASTARASTKSAGSGSTETKDADRPAQGLAIFNGTSSPDEQIVFDGTSAPDEVIFEDEPVFEIVAKGKRCSNALQHSRTQSHDLEIEFIETGHTTFTPLSVDRNSDDYPSTFILPEDAFAYPTAPPPVILFPVSTPSAASTFEGSAESHDTAASGSTGTTVAAHHRRSPLLPHHLGPALDELSEFFSARVPELSSGSSSTGSSCSSGGSASDDVSPAGSYLPPTFAPSAPISPLRKHAPRFGSVSSIPTPRLVEAPLARQRRQSASFTAAQRARMVANGQANPSLVERHVYYDWI